MTDDEGQGRHNDLFRQQECPDGETRTAPLLQAYVSYAPGLPLQDTSSALILEGRCDLRVQIYIGRAMVLKSGCSAMKAVFLACTSKGLQQAPGGGVYGV